MQYLNRATNVLAAASLAPVLAMTGVGASVGLMTAGAAAGAINGGWQTWAANPQADASEYATSMLLGAVTTPALPTMAIGGLVGTAIAGTGRPRSAPTLAIGCKLAIW